MPEFTIRRCANAEAVSLAAAEEFVRAAGESIAARQQFVTALAGGSTPRRLYELLAAEPFCSRVEWSKVEFFWGDERCVPPDHQDSNFHMAQESLLRSIPIKPAQVHRLQAERADRDAAASEAQAEIARVFRVPADGPPPAFDLVLLGMGADGHTLSLFPHTEALQETARWVVPNYVPKLGAFRLTMTPRICNSARRVMFLVAGADKAASLAEVLEGASDPARLPSQLIRPAAGSLLWLVDEAAVERLNIV